MMGEVLSCCIQNVRIFSGTDFTTRLPSSLMNVEMKMDVDLISTNVHVVQFSHRK